MKIAQDDSLPAYPFGILTKKDQFAYLQFLDIESVPDAHRVHPELLRAAILARAAREESRAAADAASSSTAQLNVETSVVDNILAQ